MDLKTLKYAYIRGYLKNNNNYQFGKFIIEKDLYSLTEDDISLLEDIEDELKLKTFYFKEKEDLPRVSIVLGFFRNIWPESVLDVGSGRGVFLFPLLREFPNIKITSIDILDRRVDLLRNISSGGVSNLVALKDDICDFSVPDNSYEVVTMLEVLEHIPNISKAIENAIRIAKKYIVITVPSKEDNNPEHIHLLTKEKLTKLFNSFGITNLKFGGVNNHLFLIARKSDNNE